MEIQNTFTTVLENDRLRVSAAEGQETLKINVKVTDSTN